MAQGRDQGMSAAPTIAMLAASSNQTYQVPFSGTVAYVHVEDAAARFVTAVARKVDGAPVFDLTGTSVDTAEVISLIKAHYPNADIGFSGGEMPFPADPNDGKLDSFLSMPAAALLRRG